MSDIKMSDVFDLPLQIAVNELAIIDKNDCVVGWADAFSGQAARDCFVDAINNHDRLAEENAELRKSLDAFLELVKAQTQTMSELNEKCKGLAEENAELRNHLQNLVDESIYLAQFKNDTLRGNIRSTDLDEPEWHDYQTIGEAGAFLERLKVNR